MEVSDIILYYRVYDDFLKFVLVLREGLKGASERFGDQIFLDSLVASDQ